MNWHLYIIIILQITVIITINILRLFYENLLLRLLSGIVPEKGETCSMYVVFAWSKNASVLNRVAIAVEANY
jgi:hypothetical protein